MCVCVCVWTLSFSSHSFGMYLELCWMGTHLEAFLCRDNTFYISLVRDMCKDLLGRDTFGSFPVS